MDNSDMQPPPRRHLLILDGIRGFAALQVVLHHYIGHNLEHGPRILRLSLIWTQFGHLAVNVFIVLSGVCLMLPVLATSSGELRGGFRGFVGRRFRRIVPPYYGALFLSCAAIQVSTWLTRSPQFAMSQATISGGASSQLSPGNLLSHLFLVHNLFPEHINSLNIALWSIATEWQIYFVFALLLLPVWNRLGLVASLIASLLLSALLHVLLAGQDGIDLACPWYIVLFTFGMATARVISRPDFASEHRWPSTSLLLIPILAVSYALLKVHQPDATSISVPNIQWLKDLTAGVIACCIIVWAVHRTWHGTLNIKPFVVRVLEHPISVGLGGMSYSLYLTHGVILIFLEALTAVLAWSAMTQLAVRAFVGIPISLAFAGLFYWIIERRFIPTTQRPTR